MVTRTDVANKAGVSTATVSRVMNQMDNVSLHIKEKVLTAARELHYYPNLMAKGLKTQRSYRLAYLIPDITNPYYTEIYRGINRIASSLGYVCILIELMPSIRPVDLLLERFDGIISAVELPMEFLRFLDQKRIPLVIQSDEKSSDFSQNCVRVGHLLSPAVFQAVDHMVSKGHKNFGLILTQGIHTERINLYKQALLRHGLDLHIVSTAETDNHRYHYITGFYAMEKLLASNQGITAIIAENDLLAIGAMTAAVRAGYSIPSDIAFLGCDDTVAAQFSNPPLSTIKRFKENQGIVSAQLLVRLIQGEKTESHQFQSEYMQRGSI